MSGRRLPAISLVLLSLGIDPGAAAGGSGASGRLRIEEVESPARAGSSQASLHASSGGKEVYLAWLEPGAERRQALRFAVFHDAGWSKPRTIFESDEFVGHPANIPSVVPLPGKALIAYWTVKGTDGGPLSNIRLARSTDGGETWSRAVTPRGTEPIAEQGFVSVLPWRDARALAIWLETPKKGSDWRSAGSGNATRLRYAMVAEDGRVSESTAVDERACECCHTSAATTSRGAVIAYRDRSRDEIRDVSVVAFSGGHWSEPRTPNPDGWQIRGCPINGPSVAAEDRRVAIAWFTAAKGAPQVQVAFSEDAGESFAGPIRVDDSNPAGRVDVVMLTDGSALVSWVERVPNGNELRVRRVAVDGSTNRSVRVAGSAAAPVGGFPRMARAGNRILLAWTQSGKVHIASATTGD